MALVEVVGLEEDPLPDFLRNEDASVDGYPGDDWLWRELGSPRVAGGYRGRRYSKHSTPSALCEPVSETLTVDLLVASEGSVCVKLSVGAAQPWSLSLWEVEGLVRMGEARQARVRQKHASIKERLRIASTTSSEIPAKVYHECNSASRCSGGPSQSMSMDEDSKHSCASRDLQSLDSAREDKPKEPKDIFVNDTIRKKGSSGSITFRLGKAFSLKQDYGADTGGRGKPKWPWTKGRFPSCPASCNRTSFSWNVIRKNMLCCVHGE